MSESGVIGLITPAPEITLPLAVKDSGDIERFNEASARNLQDMRALGLWLNGTFVPRTNELIGPLNAVFPALPTIARTARSADNIDVIVPHLDKIDIVAPHVANLDILAPHVANVDTTAKNINAVNATAKDMPAVVDAPKQAQAASNSAAAARLSEQNAKTSETGAKKSETNARASETAAKASQDAAQKSEEEARRLADFVADTIELPVIEHGDRGKAIVANAAENGWELRAPLEVVTSSGSTPADFGYTFPSGAADQTIVVEGMGLYRWSSSATDKPDGESVLLPTGGIEARPGRWLLLLPSAEIVASELGGWLADTDRLVRRAVKAGELCRGALEALHGTVSTLNTDQARLRETVSGFGGQSMYAEAAYSPGTVKANSMSTGSVAVSGVRVGDSVVMTPSTGVTGIFFSAKIDIADNLTITTVNLSSASITVASQKFVFVILRAGTIVG